MSCKLNVHVFPSKNTENFIGSNKFDTFQRGLVPPSSSVNISMRPPPGFTSNVATVSDLSAVQSRTTAPGYHSGDRVIDRGHSVMPGVVPHYDTKPHLAGPAEFASYSKAPEVQGTNNTTDVNRTG